MSRATYDVVTVRQVGGGVRLIALDRNDAAAVRRDPAMLDGGGAVAWAEMARDGGLVWIERGSSAAARNAIRREARGGGS